jgi:uncharacterized protein (DUF1697 family)
MLEAHGMTVPGTHVALLRGINVGRAKRVAMADLRALVEALGYGDVRSLLNSGNVVFAAPGVAAPAAAAGIRNGLREKLGVDVAVSVLTAAEFGVVLAENSLVELAADPSRLLVAVVGVPAELIRLQPLGGQDWAPEALAIGTRAAYLWCPDGVIKSRLVPAVDRLLGGGVTMRNWATMVKLQELLARDV